ncbi:MAG: ABC transporter permease [Clostridiales bacterium]|jgi:ABC-2 type transport system permease protein|nr:ABC transporter permease [Clostridiales bacterium]
MRVMVFASRNAKEMTRDPLNLFFGLAFPLALLVLFSAINSAIPPEANNPMFEPAKMAPGVAMFGTTFMALYSGMLLAKDRTSSFLSRLFTSPMRSSDFILGYTLPAVAFAATQAVGTFAAAAFLGLPISLKTLLAVVSLMPIALMFIGIGLLCGSAMNDKAVSGVCGALLCNVAGWLSGVWIPIDLIGGAFRSVCRALPFYHAAETARLAISGEFLGMIPHMLVVIAYSAVAYVAAVLVFRSRMHSDKA